MVSMALLGVALGWSAWRLPLTNSETLRLDIRTGQSLSTLAPQWQQEGWLPSAWLLKLQAKALNWSGLRQGEFDLPPGLTGPEFLRFLQQATPVSYRLSLIEGQNLREALLTLSKETRLVQDVNPLDFVRVSELLGIEGSPEGWIYPDTYVFQRGDKVSTLLKQGHARLKKQLDDAWATRAPLLPYRTPYEALIMASIVEKETSIASERPQIAGVFVRRLQKRMRLETDPSVIYGLGADYRGNITRAHLQDSTNRWNTYRHGGLPPSPIALVGKEALAAALHPEEGEALFFVAKGDGSHVFSSNYEAHQQAVRTYQLKRVKEYRSTPSVTKDAQ